MKAVILNSGIGARMGDLTKDQPKCLLPIGATETILGRQLRILISNGIRDVYMTTGYLDSMLKDYVNKNFPNLNVKYIYNEKYDSTDYIYSLYLAKDITDKEILLMHGDMVFEEKIFQSLLISKKENTVLIKRSKLPSKKDFNARIEQEKVVEIAVDIPGSNVCPLFPMYKLTNKSYKLWMAEIEKFIFQGEVNVLAENALNRILSQIKLEPLYYNTGFCMEIDNLGDIKIAREYYNRNIHCND